jgi:hypothetical protein
VTSSTFTDNQAGSSSDGGAILDASAGALSVNGSIFTGNRAGAGGGAIAKETGTGVTVISSTFTNNQAGATSDGGAILDASAGALTVDGSTFFANRAGASGGAIAKEAGTNIVVTLSRFLLNSAGTGGGAIFVSPAAVPGPVTNNCFSQDTAPTGGGISKSGGATLNAESNWWGAANGPSGVGPGSGDSVTANVDFDPFLTTVPSFCLQAVPALSEWAQLGLIALLLAGGLMALRRSRVRPA